MHDDAARGTASKGAETDMDRLWIALDGAGDFAVAHPFVSAWLAAATAWMLFTVARRDA